MIGHSAFYFSLTKLYKTFKSVYTFCYKNTYCKNHQNQIFQFLQKQIKNHAEGCSSQVFFLIPSNYNNIYKNYRDELLSVLWVLNIMSVVKHNIAHTYIIFLIRVTKRKKLRTQKMFNIFRIIRKLF